MAISLQRNRDRMQSSDPCAPGLERSTRMVWHIIELFWPRRKAFIFGKRHRAGLRIFQWNISWILWIGFRTWSQIMGRWGQGLLCPLHARGGKGAFESTSCWVGEKRNVSLDWQMEKFYLSNKKTLVVEDRGRLRCLTPCCEFELHTVMGSKAVTVQCFFFWVIQKRWKKLYKVILRNWE